MERIIRGANVDDINDRLLIITSKMKEKERLNKTLNHANREKDILREKMDRFSKELEKEKSDVEKLESMSVSNFIYTISGRKLEKLEKEKRDVVSAKLKHETVKNELKELDMEITRLESKIRDLGDIEGEYSAILKEKEELLKHKRPETANRLDQIVEQESMLIDKKKELNEAMEAGYELLTALERAENSLSSAENWGTWDILGGGMLVTMAKHSKLDEAQEEISNIQALARTFHRELEDVETYESLTIEIGSFLTFADYFFDGWLADLSVQSKIKDASKQIRNAQNKISTTLTRLNYDLKNTDIKVEDLNTERLKLIESAK